MQANEMKYQVLLGIDSLYENAAPGYSDIQISAILNKAQRRVFNEKKKLFDSNEEIKRILSPLNRRANIISGTITKVTGTTYAHLNGEFYLLPVDAAKITEEFVKLKVSLSPLTYSNPVIVLPITYDYYAKNYDNSFKKPCDKLVWRLDYNTNTVVDGDESITKYVVELITDGLLEIGDYQISYLKYPSDIVVNTVTTTSQVDCEILDKNTQDEIVSEAIKIISGILSEEGYQVALNEKNFDI